MLAFGAAIGAVGLAGLIDALTRSRRLHRQRALRGLAKLSWQQFEELIVDAFRRHGYRVREVGGRGRADGEVDVVLGRADETTIVQAKHWRRDRVGVALVRELYGVQRAMRAQRSMFVAMGSSTADATQFAAQVGMTLVDGEELLRIIGTGAARRGPRAARIAVGQRAPVSACGAAIVRRTADRGQHAGDDFWGCSTFPACRGTVPILDEAPIAL
jgi:restriction system protein